MRGFLLAFAMAILLLTFGMTGGRLVQVLEYISQGIPFSAFARFTLYIMPIVLTFTVPWAVMVAVMLVFGRLSADSEITAMRACGVSILQIVSPILLFTLLLTGFCLYLQVEVGPPWLGKSREVMKIAAINQPLALFEPGRMVEYERSLICIDEKIGEDVIKGIQLYTLNDQGYPAQDITAATGKLVVNQEEKTMDVHLYDCLVINKTTQPASRVFNEELAFTIDYGKQMNELSLGAKAKYMTLKELIARIRIVKMAGKDWR